MIIHTLNELPYWDTSALVNKAIIVSDSGLSPVRRQAIIWNNVGKTLIGPIGTYFSEKHISCKKHYL